MRAWRVPLVVPVLVLALLLAPVTGEVTRMLHTGTPSDNRAQVERFVGDVAAVLAQAFVMLLPSGQYSTCPAPYDPDEIQYDCQARSWSLSTRR
ncbi:hypothetical protein J2Z79_002117 [Symbiobacterium terraclitae]|uniref:Uncharacterized protein n=1 Tax=Symbiobacterium terraclitae TaxID=557451 RepID=A0ABS4JT39_9FIRM|nr:hypothetical protein [Symbiobacterium terraclitae]MBP2018702.1 hypothetical protein [Symbiobacterium terraclitae]